MGWRPGGFFLLRRLITVPCDSNASYRQYAEKLYVRSSDAPLPTDDRWCRQRHDSQHRQPDQGRLFDPDEPMQCLGETIP